MTLPSWHTQVLNRRVSAAILAGALFMLLPAAAHAGELGAFFVTAPASGFEQGPHQGARIALRKRVAYTVVGMAWERDGRHWLKLSVLEQQRTLQGDGWTPLTDEELAARGKAPAEVYLHPIDLSAASSSGTPSLPASATLSIPAKDLQLRVAGGNSGEGGRATGPIVWRPVHYTIRRPGQAWIPATQGIYRPNRTPSFLTAAYQEMMARHVPEESVRRMLAGIVRVGDSVQDARWAWGEPLRTGSEGPEGLRQTVWEYAEGQLRFSGAAIQEVR